jgi:murein DD-endopeptidase MepM/ murein hydrolase activator NlpD
MKKIKYYYNTHSLRYEKYEESLVRKALRIIGIISAALVFAFIVMYLAYTYLDSPKEKVLNREISQMQLQYDILNQKEEQMNQVLSDLADRDDNIYRVVFEADPIPRSEREAGFGGTNRYANLEDYDNSDLMIQTTQKLDQLRQQMYIQSKSYDELDKLIKNKKDLLASIPSIQPIANRQLTRIASGFGMRIDPIYKVPIFHSGLDFVAPTGTPIHATGDGVIEEVNGGQSGYGNYVMIKHGFGYETLYGHMSHVNVRVGQKVNRGDVIGFVGSTGRSTGPHCHYEVIKDGHKINPINFFSSDLTPEEYQKILELSERSNQSFD